VFYSLVNKVLQSTLRKYVEELFEVIEQPLERQEHVLLDFIEKAKNTQYGQLHHFDKIQSIQDFMTHVPLSDYGDLKPFIEKMREGAKDILWPGKVEWYAKSSGTSSGVSKYIPVPKESLEGTHMNGGRIELACTSTTIHPPNSLRV
jgi:hypothetical protein